MNWIQFAEKEKGTLTSCQYVYEEGVGGLSPYKKIGVSFYNECDNEVFDIKDNGEFNLGNFSHLGAELSKNIVDFINQGADEWFKVKKYKIILGEDDDGTLSEYHKSSWGGYHISFAPTDGVTQTCEVFTQEEIDDLKSRLPENMAKIVDLGKVEVKDNGD